MVSKIHRRGLSITLEIVLLLMGTTAHSQDAAKRDALLLPLPIVCTNPTAGIIYGAGVSYTTRQPAARYISVITGNATNSTNGILNLSAKSNLFTGTGRWLVNTEWRFQDNIETTYGLGSGRPGPAELSFEGLSTMLHSNIGQELQWQQLRFYQVVSRLVAPNLFAGIGFRFDRYRHIIDDKTRAGDSSSSYQYDFSVLHGFHPDHYSVSGVCINFLYDDRDNEINAYTGYYLNVNYQVNSTTFGSSQNSQVLLIDGRAYYSLDGRDFSRKSGLSERLQKCSRFLDIRKFSYLRPTSLPGAPRPWLRSTSKDRSWIYFWPLPRRGSGVPGVRISISAHRAERPSWGRIIRQLYVDNGPGPSHPSLRICADRLWRGASHYRQQKIANAHPDGCRHRAACGRVVFRNARNILDIAETDAKKFSIRAAYRKR